MMASQHVTNECTPVLEASSDTSFITGNDNFSGTKRYFDAFLNQLVEIHILFIYAITIFAFLLWHQVFMKQKTNH